jgi:signal transduction histidine kinase
MIFNFRTLHYSIAQKLLSNFVRLYIVFARKLSHRIRQSLSAIRTLRILCQDFSNSFLPRFVTPWAPANPRIAEQEATIDELSAANQEYAQEARGLRTYLEHQQRANADLQRALARVPVAEATDEEYSPA